MTSLLVMLVNVSTTLDAEHQSSKRKLNAKEKKTHESIFTSLCATPIRINKKGQRQLCETLVVSKHQTFEN